MAQETITLFWTRDVISLTLSSPQCVYFVTMSLGYLRIGSRGSLWHYLKSPCPRTAMEAQMRGSVFCIRDRRQSAWSPGEPVSLELK